MIDQQSGSSDQCIRTGTDPCCSQQPTRGTALRGTRHRRPIWYGGRTFPPGPLLLPPRSRARRAAPGGGARAHQQGPPLGAVEVVGDPVAVLPPAVGKVAPAHRLGASGQCGGERGSVEVQAEEVVGGERGGAAARHAFEALDLHGLRGEHGGAVVHGRGPRSAWPGAAAVSGSCGEGRADSP